MDPDGEINRRFSTPYYILFKKIFTKKKSENLKLIKSDSIKKTLPEKIIHGYKNIFSGREK